jgi:hypothetical protein
MNQEEFRIIPGYNGYSVTRDGTVKSFERDLILRQYTLDGYQIVDTFRGSLTETLPVHRAVALAWVQNTGTGRFNLVNHIDGIRQNNWFENLEWTDYSGNNYHAVNTGLRSDNINCRVRDFLTKQVYDFNSMAQAAEFMGLPKDAPLIRLQPKKFGTLVNDRFEFRFDNDPTPWFYESREERVPPSRYMITAKDSDGQVTETYSTKVLLKQYQLYGSESRAIPELVAHASQIHKDKVFEVRDSYKEENFRVTRNTEKSVVISIRAESGNNYKDFGSLSKCAADFNVDRSSISSRLNNGKTLDGWTFSELPL